MSLNENEKTNSFYQPYVNASFQIESSLVPDERALRNKSYLNANIEKGNLFVVFNYQLYFEFIQVLCKIL
jgi:hypothetical protein